MIRFSYRSIPILLAWLSYLIATMILVSLFGWEHWQEYINNRPQAWDIPVPETQGTLTGTLVAVSHTGECVKNPIISVFMYHYVRRFSTKEPQVVQWLSVNPDVFDWHMWHIRTLMDAGKVYVAKPSELVAFQKSQCYPNTHIFAFISDDGWQDSYDEIFPIIQKYRIPFAFAIIGKRIGTQGFMTRDAITEMIKSPYTEIVSHSVRHMEHNRLTLEQERYEICDSKAILEKTFGIRITTYVFPSGKHSSNSPKLLHDCGYTSAYTTRDGSFSSESMDDDHTYALPRVRIVNTTPITLFDTIIGHSNTTTVMDSSRIQAWRW